MLWFHCDAATGAIVTGGVAPPIDAPRQVAPEGEILIVVDDGMVGRPFSEEPDFTSLKAKLSNDIDMGAAAAHQKFYTDVLGRRDETVAEARRWQAGDDAAGYPFMSAEAQVRGLSVAQVQEEIMAEVNRLTPTAALIEAHKVAARQAVQNAANLPVIVGAADVDWLSLVAQ
ncbi:MAG TPA: hypothetical protein VF503_01380 [Sphingobium sp.]|uniref:hypothetical protein n=1 Tax=Sphingobium sp. TaxID=1912891 RepID=UPI002ECFFC29